MAIAITITGNATDRWQFSIDRGGTFTDVIGIDPKGRLHTAKLLSDSPAYPHAAIEGIRRLLDLPPDAPIPEDRVARSTFPPDLSRCLAPYSLPPFADPQGIHQGTPYNTYRLLHPDLDLNCHRQPQYYHVPVYLFGERIA